MKRGLLLGFLVFLSFFVSAECGDLICDVDENVTSCAIDCENISNIGDVYNDEVIQSIDLVSENNSEISWIFLVVVVVIILVLIIILVLWLIRKKKKNSDTGMMPIVKDDSDKPDSSGNVLTATPVQNQVMGVVEPVAVAKTSVVAS